MKHSMLIIQLFKNNFKKIVLLFIISLISLLLYNIVLPYMNGFYIDDLTYKININTAIKTIIWLALLNFLGITISFLQTYSLNYINTKIAISINTKLIEHLHKCPLKYTRQFNPTFLTEQINNDSNIITNYYIGIATQGTVGLIIFITTILILSKFSLLICLFFLLSIPLYLLIYYLFKKSLYSSSLKLKNEQSNFFSEINQQMSDIKSIKLNSWFSEYRKNMTKAYSNFFNFVVKFINISTLSTSVNALLLSIVNLITLLIGGIEVINNKITIGELTIIITYINSLVGSFQYFIEQAKNYQTTKVSVDRLENHLKVPLENNGEIKLDHIDYIQLENVSFQYDGKVIIENLSYMFEKGKVYGIIGRNGMGKSTLINLICGIFQDYTGHISYNNLPIEELNLYEIRKKVFGVAEQNQIQFRTDLITSIKFGNNEPDESLLSGMLKGFHLVDKIELESKDSDLSGGELQKSSIIRALLKDPQVLILDEPTSMMDKNGYNYLISIINEIKTNKIIILITHDNSLKFECDEILDLEEQFLLVQQQ